MSTTRKPSYTPGPWQFTGDRVRSEHRIVTHARGAFGHEQVALALDFNEFARDAEADANARLIALAPELVEALRELLASDIYEREGHLEADVTVTVDWLNKVQTLLAKIDEVKPC